MYCSRSKVSGGVSKADAVGVSTSGLIAGYRVVRKKLERALLKDLLAAEELVKDLYPLMQKFD
jgi:hypothetical protein